MSKPKPRSDESDGRFIFLDSDDEEDELEEKEEEDEDEDYWDTKSSSKLKQTENNEDDPFSYSWRLMRLAAVKLAKAELKRIVSIAGIEMSGMISSITHVLVYSHSLLYTSTSLGILFFLSELSHISPYLDGVIRVLNVWQVRLFKELESRAPPPVNFLQNAAVESVTGPPIHKYRALLDPTNTPFP
jgi:hypothetical protein